MPSPFVVLMVENDHATLSLLGAIARREGFEFLLASDGAQALAMIHHHQIDAVVLDLLLPKSSGFDILRYFSQNQPALLQRTIVITAASEQAYQDCEEVRHVRRFFHKPLDVAELTSALHACRAVKGRDAAESPAPGTATPSF